MKAPYQLLRAARNAFGIEHVDLARLAGVSVRTLVRIETLRSVSEESRAKVQHALEQLGTEFMPSENGRGPGIRIPRNAILLPVMRSREPGGTSEARENT